MTKIITVESRNVLLTRDFIFDLSASVSRIAVSRRQLVEYGTQTLYDWIEFGGVIVTDEGERSTFIQAVSMMCTARTQAAYGSRSYGNASTRKGVLRSG